MDKKQDPRTVFVRGIDASVDDTQLQEFFAEVGPVKNAFLVRRGKAGPHRGFGFVQFAVQEDAVRAAADLHGAELAGRKLKVRGGGCGAACTGAAAVCRAAGNAALRNVAASCRSQVEGAVKRAPLEERKKRKQDAAAAPAEPAEGQQEGQQEAAAPAAKKARPARPARPADAAAPAGAAAAKHKWLRTVAVGGLTAQAMGAALALARAAGQVEEVVQPVPEQLAQQFMLKRDGCSGEAFLAVYKDVKQATAAVAKLHGQAAGKAGGACRVWARQLSGDGLHQKRWRLIVRNLPFNVRAGMRGGERAHCAPVSLRARWRSPPC